MRGIKTWRNPKNGFFVCQVHYTADPDKDPTTTSGKEWQDSVKTGMPEEGWLREYEISWATMEGKPVYMEFKNEQIVEVKWDRKWVVYRGWDLGYHHPVVNFSFLNDDDQWCWAHEVNGWDIDIDKFGLKILDVTKAKFPNALIRDFFPHDAANVKDVSTEKEEKTDAAILGGIGIFGEVTRSDLWSGIKLIQRKMRIRDDGKFGMLVDPSMKLSIEALQGGYHRSSKPGKENDVVKNHIHDDPMDAARMTAVNIFAPEITESLKEGKWVEDDLYVYDPVTGCVIA